MSHGPYVLQPSRMVGQDFFSFDTVEVRYFRSRRWGSSLLGLRTLAPPLGLTKWELVSKQPGPIARNKVDNPRLIYIRQIRSGQDHLCKYIEVVFHFF